MCACLRARLYTHRQTDTPTDRQTVRDRIAMVGIYMECVCLFVRKALVSSPFDLILSSSLDAVIFICFLCFCATDEKRDGVRGGLESRRFAKCAACAVGMCEYVLCVDSGIGSG